MAFELRVFLFLVVSCNTMTACLGQDSDEQDHEYVFTIPQLSWSIESPRVMITTTSEDPVVATLSIPGYVAAINRTITRTNGADIELPADIKMNRRDGKQTKTVIVRASGDVSVYAIDNNYCCGDAFQCISSSHLGTKYSVASYKQDSTYPPSICVSALHSSTTVTISNAKEIIHSVTLNQYESYRYDGDEYDDLSGLLVHGTNAIAVITGSYDSSGNMAQLSPTATWGTEYQLFPFKSLNSGFVYRVYTFNVSTTLYLSNDTLIEIKPGHFYEGDVLGDTAVSIEADQPVMVAQHMKGYFANTPGRGSQSMFIVPPVSSYTKHVTFPVFEPYYNSGHTYYINIVTHCDNIDGIIFDKAISVAIWNTLTTYTKTMCCVRNEVSAGYHSVAHINPNATFSVSVYVICNGCSSSYAYVASGIYELAKRQTTMLTTDKVSLPTDQTASEEPESGHVVIIAASVGGVVLIAVGLIVTIWFCRKRCKTSGDDSKYYSSSVPRRHQAPAPKLPSRNNDSRDDNNAGYETTQDNAAYQDLELSTMTSSD